MLDAALQALHAQGLRARVVQEAKPNDRHDGKVELGLADGAPRRFVVEVKRHVSKATAAALIEQLRIHDVDLLITDYVAPELADRFKTEGVQFADAAGNGFIHGPSLFFWVKGNRPRRDAAHELRMDLRKKTAARAFEPSGLKILFAFLCDPKLVDRPYREIADKADVAHGSVGWVMAELPHRGYVLDFPGEGRRLLRAEELLAEWAASYARKLRPKLPLGRYRAKDPQWWQDFDAAAYGAVLGAEPAAAKVTKHLRPEIITVYADRPVPKMLAEQGLRPDPNGNVEIAKRFWRFETDETKKGLAPLPLIYADLLATGDPRCIEAAGIVRERYLANRS